LVKPRQFYYHFKHDPKKEINDHTYLVIGIGQDTENRENYFVIYKPLYFCQPKKLDEVGVSFHIRPYQMFVENVQKPEYNGPRFVQIIDKELIAELKLSPLYSSKYMDC
jgi:hypothetical protein